MKQSRLFRISISLLVGTIISVKIVESTWTLPTLIPSQGFAMAATSKTEENQEEVNDAVLVDETVLGSSVCEAPEALLQSLSRERKLVGLQIEALDKRKAEISLAVTKLNVDKKSLLALKATLEDLLEKAEKAQSQDLERLIGFYQNMKPNAAALIIEDLDIEVSILVLTGMKPRTAAEIMAKLSPKRARALSKIILERSKFPGDQDFNGLTLN